MATVYYTSDLHLGHRNVIAYCHRPFRDVKEMDEILVRNLRTVDALPRSMIVCAGDVSLNLSQAIKRYGPIFADKRMRFCVIGNHDQTRWFRETDNPYLKAYLDTFQSIAGNEDTWEENYLVVDDVLDGERVMVQVSHKPQELLSFCAVNVHGHIHNSDLIREEQHRVEDGWALGSPVHFCSCVELCSYRPMTLQQLADEKRAGYPTGKASLAEFDVMYPNGLEVVRRKEANGTPEKAV